MPKLSLWRNGDHSADYRFIDKQIRGMLTAGGTGCLIHKYLGPQNPADPTNNPTVPTYPTQSETNIQDMLFLENRDRVYDTSIYDIRGHYNVANLDFDLSQFGLFLSSDIIFIVFHINDMIDILGRKLMVGDVIELPHIRDYNPLNTTLDASLARFFVIQDAANASEGFSQTWWPHLWRVKCGPLVDSQEYKSILDQIAASDNVTTPVGQIVSNYQTQLGISEAVLSEAEGDTPQTGYNVDNMYVLPIIYNSQGEYPGAGPGIQPTSDVTTVTADNVDSGGANDGPLSNFTINADIGADSPDKKQKGYLSGDGVPPDGFPVGAGITFPSNPMNGDFFLRLDFLPNRLFRYNGSRWTKIEDAVRTNYTPGGSANNPNQTQLESFYNNTATFVDDNNTTQPSLQSLSGALRPGADNGEVQ
jgi:hypothetical protein